MASELRVNTLKDASGNNSVGMTYVAGGSAKMWVNFNGESTLAIRDDLNVTSVTDNDTGDYTINMTSAMSDANYAALVTCSRDDTPNGIGTINGSVASPTSSALRITGRIPTTSGTVDTAFSNAAAHGDLA